MKFRLKDFRQTHKLFQSEMAELMETNQSTISRMEMQNSCKLTCLQKQRLYERFGQEDVDAFMDDGLGEVSVHVNGNTNEGDGTQNNGLFTSDTLAMTIIRQQSEALTRIAAKQAEQADKLIALLEKLHEKA